jgi:hypothetical protein
MLKTRRCRNNKLRLSLEYLEGRQLLSTATLVGTPVISPVIYGKALTAQNVPISGLTVQDATTHASVAGSWAYTGADAGKVLGIGTRSEAITFTPKDSSYPKVTSTVSLKINPATLAVTPKSYTPDPFGFSTSALVVPYGSAPPLPYYWISGYVNGESASSANVTGSPVLTTPYVKGADAGVYSISVASMGTLSAPNYVFVASTFVRQMNCTTVTPTVTGTPTAAPLTYGQRLGIASISNVTVKDGFGTTVTGTWSFTGTDTGKLLPVGSYPEQVTFTPDNHNYNPVTKTVSVTVSPRDLTVTATGVNKVYDGTTAAAVILADNRLNGDSLSISYAMASFADKNVGVGKVVTVTGINITGADAANYHLVNTTASTGVNITPATLTVTARGRSKVYGTTLALGTTAFTTTGLVSGDTVTGVTLTSSGAAATAHVNSYAVTPSAAQGSGLSNYIIQYATGTLTVTPAALTIRALNQSFRKNVGTWNLDQSKFSTSGLLNGDTVTSVVLAALGNPPNPHHANNGTGTYVITISGAAGSLTLSDYAITYVTGTLRFT